MLTCLCRKQRVGSGKQWNHVTMNSSGTHVRRGAIVLLVRLSNQGSDCYRTVVVVVVVVIDVVVVVVVVVRRHRLSFVVRRRWSLLSLSSSSSSLSLQQASRSACMNLLLVPPNIKAWYTPKLSVV